jgi:hypothetical protein
VIAEVSGSQRELPDLLKGSTDFGVHEHCRIRPGALAGLDQHG